jgi:ATP-binding cassette, subfamily B (MDR/TAP), member 1
MNGMTGPDQPSAGDSGVNHREANAPTDPFEDNDADLLKNVSWKALFYFTTTKHIVPLGSAIILAILAGLVIPSEAVLLGEIFQSFSSFAAHEITEDEFSSQVTKWCIGLVGLATGSWIFHGAFFFSWMLFGDVQANSARQRLFKSLLNKEMKWYDLRRNGVAALMPRLQMYAINPPHDTAARN